MTTNITHGATTLTPLLVLGYQTTIESGNLVHRTLSGATVITFRDASLRTGTLEILCENEAEALATVSLHRLPGLFALADSDLSGVAMFYVPQGTISSELDDETRAQWVVRVGYQEVLA